jgi:hypothetical protein
MSLVDDFYIPADWYESNPSAAFRSHAQFRRRIVDEAVGNFKIPPRNHEAPYAHEGRRRSH